MDVDLVAPDDRDMGTERGQLMGRATPDTAPAAGDDDDLVTKQVPAVDRVVGHVVRPGLLVAIGARRHPVGVAPLDELLLAFDDLRIAHGRIAIQALKPELVVQWAADDLEDCLLR